MSLANRHEFLQGMHKKLEMHLIDHTVYQTNMAVTLKLLMVGYPPTWESIPIISWCCIHIRQRHIREMFTNLFRMYPKKCVLMAQVHPTTELFFTFPAAVLDEMIGKGWAAFILEGFLSKRVPLHRNSKRYLIWCVASMHPPIFLRRDLIVLWWAVGHGMQVRPKTSRFP